MQKSIIDELCYAFSEEILEPNLSEEYKQMKEEEALCYKKLCKSIDEESRKHLIAFVGLHEELDMDLEIRNFRRGFKLGVRLILESILGDKSISDLLE